MRSATAWWEPSRLARGCAIAELGATQWRSPMLPERAVAAALLALIVPLAYLWLYGFARWERNLATPARRREMERERSEWQPRGIQQHAWRGLVALGIVGGPFVLALDGLGAGPGILYAPGVTFGGRLALPIQIAGLVCGAVGVAIMVGVGRYVIEHVYARAAEERCVLTTGPYAYVRHPFYVHFLLVPAAVVMITLNYIAFAAFVYVFVDENGPMLLTREIRAEERFLQARFGDEYERYARKTGALFPKLRRPIRGPGSR